MILRYTKQLQHLLWLPAPRFPRTCYVALTPIGELGVLVGQRFKVATELVLDSRGINATTVKP